MIRGGIVSRRKASVETTDVSANLIYAGPASGAAAPPSFRSLVNADFPATLSPSIKNINLSDLSNGYVPYKSSGGLANSPIYTDGTNVGIGTTTPSGKLHIEGDFSNTIPGLVITNTSLSIGDKWLSLKDGAGNILLDIASQNGSNRVRFSFLEAVYFNTPYAVVNYNSGAMLQLEGNAGVTHKLASYDGNIQFVTRGTSPGYISFAKDETGSGEIMRLTQDSNVAIGTTTPGGSSTVGSKVLSIANGTEPIGGVANQVSLFSKTGELYVMDSAGNKTLLSPHPGDFLDTLSTTHPFPWAYRSENEYLGKRISVDLAGLVAAVEKLTGQKFMFVEDIPQRNWDEDQEAQRLAREKEIQNALQQIVDLEQKIEAEEDEDKKQELIKQKESIVVPEPYMKKDPPKWIKDRIVITKEATA